SPFAFFPQSPPGPQSKQSICKKHFAPFAVHLSPFASFPSPFTFRLSPITFFHFSYLPSSRLPFSHKAREGHKGNQGFAKSILLLLPFTFRPSPYSLRRLPFALRLFPFVSRGCGTPFSHKAREGHKANKGLAKRFLLPSPFTFRPSPFAITGLLFPTKPAKATKQSKDLQLEFCSLRRLPFAFHLFPFLLSPFLPSPFLPQSPPGPQSKARICD
ncbi:MAG TPA: hypothetical protein PKL70_06015, partial [Saprospiraceae bacterium]|nr:hypothetical protein [Saprospiraceae bacterium]